MYKIELPDATRDLVDQIAELKKKIGDAEPAALKTKEGEQLMEIIGRMRYLEQRLAWIVCEAFKDLPF